MATRKSTKNITSSTVTKEVSKPKRRAAPRAPKKVESEMSFQDVDSTDSKPTKSSPFKLTRKSFSVIVGLGIFVLVMVLANKYLVVAWVNKKPISSFEYYKALDARYGKDLKEELIVERLLTDEAANKKVSVTNAEIDAEVKKLEDQQGGADKLNQALQLQNLSRDDLRKFMKLQLLRGKLFGGNITVTDDEINKYAQSAGGTGAPDEATPGAALDQKTKDGISEQLKQQKINDAFNTWITAALKGPSVVRN